MDFDNQNNHTDIVFVGSGISSSFTILNLLDRLKNDSIQKKISLTIVDKYSEFYTGIPYGMRSGFSVLLITSLKNFLPQPELGKFILWLNKNKRWLLEAVDLNKTQDQYSVILDTGQILWSEKVILSVGSLPTKHLWKQEDLIVDKNLIFVNNPYKPCLKEVLKKIETFIDQGSDIKRNALIVGANASGLEMLYKLNDYKGLQSKIHTFTLLSTQGLSPDAIIDEEGKKEYIPKNLLALADKKTLTAKQIAEATYSDLDLADEISLGAASTVDVISAAFGSLFKKLDQQELKNFACLYGNDIGRRQRCAGYHYAKTIEDLKAENRFNHIAGRFVDLKKEVNDQYSLEYLDTKSGTHKFSNDTMQIIFNCIGSTNFKSDDIPVLFQKIIDKGLCIPNKSQIGFEVNEALESSHNLHIMGPLLAGNIFEGKAVWHVEHCGRIIWLSKILADKIYEYFKP